MKIEINVTQEDINKGRANNCFNCPVALAIKRETRNPNVKVFNTLAIIDEGYYSLPKSVQNFIQSFDGFVIVDEIKFELDIPETSIL